MIRYFKYKNKTINVTGTTSNVWNTEGMISGVVDEVGIPLISNLKKKCLFFFLAECPADNMLDGEIQFAHRHLTTAARLQGVRITLRLNSDRNAHTFTFIIVTNYVMRHLIMHFECIGSLFL